MSGRKPRGLRPDEEALWRKVRDSATPLHPEKRPSLPQAVSRALTPVPAPQKRQAIAPFEIGQKANGAVWPGAIKGTAPGGGALNMDRKKFQKLKRGKLLPQARLDLHGMTIAQAHPALVAFVLKAHGDGLRLVLVITGKGRAGVDDGPIPTRKGVLRHHVPQWLQAAPLKGVVLQVSEAHTRHGGGGALYVYLRNRR